MTIKTGDLYKRSILWTTRLLILPAVIFCYLLSTPLLHVCADQENVQTSNAFPTKPFSTSDQETNESSDELKDTEEDKGKTFVPKLFQTSPGTAGTLVHFSKVQSNLWLFPVMEIVLPPPR